MHLTKFRKLEKWKNKKLKFVNENLSTVPKLLFFIATDLYTVYLFSIPNTLQFQYFWDFNKCL